MLCCGSSAIPGVLYAEQHQPIDSILMKRSGPDIATYKYRCDRTARTGGHLLIRRKHSNTLKTTVVFMMFGIAADAFWHAHKGLYSVRPQEHHAFRMMLKSLSHNAFAGLCQQPNALFLSVPALFIRPDATCYSTLNDQLGQSLRFANTNTTQAASNFGNCCQCSVFGPHGCSDDQICVKSEKFGPTLDGGRCTSNAAQQLHADVKAFAIGAYVPDVGFKCGCFP